MKQHYLNSPTSLPSVQSLRFPRQLPFNKSIKLLLLFFLIGASGLMASNNPEKGYIVTKDGIFLSGYIGDIYHSPRASIVTFINDLGDIYHLEAELIKGFVCRGNQSVDAYKSHLIGRRWFFLKVMVKSKGVVLYQAPLEVSFQQSGLGLAETRTRTTARFWLEWKDKTPMRLQRLGYRNKLRKLLQEKAPSLADKVGSKGYRFGNIPSIIEEYCHILEDQRRPRS
jgi:hypothetical protein